MFVSDGSRKTEFLERVFQKLVNFTRGLNREDPDGKFYVDDFTVDYPETAGSSSEREPEPPQPLRSFDVRIV